MKKLVLAMMSVACLLSMQALAQLPTSMLDVSPLLIGEKFPDGTLTDTKGNSVSMNSLLNGKPTVVIFYRGDWCPNCINHFNEEISPNLSAIASLGYNFIAISPDAPEKLLSTAEKTKISASKFFGDSDGSYSKSIGIAYNEKMEMLKDLLVESSGGKNTERILPVPAVFVVGADQSILFEYMNPNGPQSNLRMKWTLLEPVLKALK